MQFGEITLISLGPTAVTRVAVRPNSISILVLSSASSPASFLRSSLNHSISPLTAAAGRTGVATAGVRRRPACSPVCSQGRGKRLPRADDVAPGALREPHLRGALEPAERRNDDAVAGETREHRHARDAAAPRRGSGVPASRSASRPVGAQRREVVVAVYPDDRVDVGEARRVGDADQGVQAPWPIERSPLGELLGERASTGSDSGGVGGLGRNAGWAERSRKIVDVGTVDAKQPTRMASGRSSRTSGCLGWRGNRCIGRRVSAASAPAFDGRRSDRVAFGRLRRVGPSPR